MQEMVFTPSDFVAVLNQTLEYAYPSVTIEGEISNFRISRNRWVYFDLKDEGASVKCFSTVYALPGPLEDGMVVRVFGQPRLSPQYGFSVTCTSITPVGEGSLKRAANLLLAKLEKEGLFDPERKRGLPYPPQHIGLVASKESAAYADFIKILNARWGGIKISHVDVQVQGEQAVSDVVKAITLLNEQGTPPEVIVVTRGGGSADDLAAFSTEQVTRAVAGSRIPTLVAIGHEVDMSLAELAADVRASTPSNAAELLVPDKKALKVALKATRAELIRSVKQLVLGQEQYVAAGKATLERALQDVLSTTQKQLQQHKALLAVLNPEAALKRGYAVIRDAKGQYVTSVKSIKKKTALLVQMHDGTVDVSVDKVH